jgi:hypothetical protein
MGQIVDVPLREDIHTKAFYISPHLELLFPFPSEKSDTSTLMNMRHAARIMQSKTSPMASSAPLDADGHALQSTK